jgi:hypothetical protein
VVETKPKISKNNGEPSKRHKNGDLPSDIDIKIWRRVFIPTFLRWVSQQENPFEHNGKLTCEVMQKIWDAIFSDVPYMIIQSGPVYTLVNCYFYGSYTLLYSMLQAAQRASDSLRNPVGSTAIAIILAYCNSNLDLKDSDDNRQEFAAYYLEHLRFLYRKSDDDNPEVSIPFRITDQF